MEHILCSWIGRLCMVKMYILPKAMCRFNTLPTTIPIALFRNRKMIPKFIRNHKNVEPPKRSWQEEQCLRHHTSRFHKATKINHYGTGEERHIDEQSKIEIWKINPHLYDQQIFDKDVKNAQQGRIISSTSGAIFKYNWTV